jgi:hypothetical protein
MALLEEIVQDLRDALDAVRVVQNTWKPLCNAVLSPRRNAPAAWCATGGCPLHIVGTHKSARVCTNSAVPPENRFLKRFFYLKTLTATLTAKKFKDSAVLKNRACSGAWSALFSRILLQNVKCKNTPV